MEEGWRYHQNFVVNIKYGTDATIIEKEVDLTTEHQVMAHLLRSVSSSSDRKSCLIRFTPIVLINGEIKLGKTVYLTEEPFHVFYQNKTKKFQFSYPELVFLSGFGEQKNKNIAPYKTTYDFVFERTRVPNAFSTFPPALLKNENSLSCPFALNIIQRNYVNLGFLERQLNFRYTNPSEHTPTCFSTGNYPNLYQVVQETKEQFIKNANQIQDITTRAAYLLYFGDIDGATKLFDKDTASITAIRSTHTNVKMNDFACAEQGAFYFLGDDRIKDYLRTSVEIDNPNVLGILINAHCSHTPCCSCATSFAREREPGGVFDHIFKRKQTFFICSTQNHYPRDPKGMIRYDDTHFVGKIDSHATSVESEFERLTRTMKQKLELRIHPTDALGFSTYPIILMAYNLDNSEFEPNEAVYHKVVREYLKKNLKSENDGSDGVDSSEEEMTGGLFAESE